MGDAVAVALTGSQYKLRGPQRLCHCVSRGSLRVWVVPLCRLREILPVRMYVEAALQRHTLVFFVRERERRAEADAVEGNDWI